MFCPTTVLVYTREGKRARGALVSVNSLSVGCALELQLVEAPSTVVVLWIKQLSIVAAIAVKNSRNDN